MSRKLLVFLALAVFGLAAYMLFGRDFDSRLFVVSLQTVRPGWLAGAILLTFLCYVIRAFRWQVLLISLKLIKLAPLVSGTILGFAAIYALGRAGEFVRPLWVSRRESVSLGASFATIAVERVFDMLMLILFFALSLTLVELPRATESTMQLLEGSAWTLLTVSAGALAAFVVFRRVIGVFARRLPFPRLARWMNMFAEGLAVTSDPRRLLFVSLYSLLLWLGIALQFWLMLVGLNFDFTFGAATLIMVAAGLGSIAQVPGIGGGFQAGFVFSITTLFLVPVERAIAASLLAWVFSYLPTIVAAVLYMGWKGISTRDLMRQETPLTP